MARLLEPWLYLHAPALVDSTCLLLSFILGYLDPDRPLGNGTSCLSPRHSMHRRCVVLLFIMALDSFHPNISSLEFGTLCNDYGIGSEFDPELPSPNDTIRDFPKGKIGVYTRFFEFANFRLPLPTFLLRVQSHFRIHISQLSVVGAGRISHFDISYRPHGHTPNVHLFCRFYLASNLPTGWITIEKRWKKKITLCFSGKEFPRDSVVDGIDGDMALETLLNDNPTRISRYPEEILVLTGLSRLWYATAVRPVFYDEDEEDEALEFIKVPNPFDVVFGEKNLLEKERPILEQTIDVVFPAAALPLPTNARKRAPAEEFILGMSTSSRKGLSVLVSKKPLSKKSHMVIMPPKSVMGESVVGSSYEAADDLCSLEAGLNFIDHLATPGQFSCLRSMSHKQVYDHANVAETRHITLFFEIRLRLEHCKLVRGKLERRLAYRDVAVEKRDVAFERLIKLLNEKPSREIAQLRLGFERGGRLRKQVEELKMEAGKVPGLLALYSYKETDLSIISGKYQDLLYDKEHLELHNASLRGQVDGEAEFAWLFDDQQRRFDERVAALYAHLDKMAKETAEEFTPMLRFKESELLGTCLAVCLSAVISDRIRQGLEAGFVHGKKGTDISYIPAYNPNAAEVYTDAPSALNDVSFPLLEHIKACTEEPFAYLESLLVMVVHESIQDEARTSTNPASGLTSSAGGGADQFIVAPSVKIV
ncbi:hypothetical protein Tco_0881759 [Tanacetum coccineum]